MVSSTTLIRLTPAIAIECYGAHDIGMEGEIKRINASDGAVDQTESVLAFWLLPLTSLSAPTEQPFGTA